MKKMILMGLCLMGLALSYQTAEAQKYAYVNSDAILGVIPEMEQMRSNLEGYQAQLQKKGQQMVQEFQAQQTDAAAKKERGELSPVQEQQILEALQKKQNEILQYEQEMQNMMLTKQEELLKPIIEKVNTAINEVSKEDGYTMVFDMSSGAILFADPLSDITPKVKAKLGITDAPAPAPEGDSNNK